MHVLHNMFISLCESRVTAKQKLVVPVLLYTILCICYKILDSPVFVTYQETNIVKPILNYFLCLLWNIIERPTYS